MNDATPWTEVEEQGARRPGRGRDAEMTVTVAVEAIYARLLPEFGEDVTQEVLRIAVEKDLFKRAEGMGYFVQQAKWVRAEWARHPKPDTPVPDFPALIEHGGPATPASQEEFTEVRALLALMPPEVRLTIEVGPAEAARALGISEGTLKSRSNRWRKRARARRRWARLRAR